MHSLRLPAALDEAFCCYCMKSNLLPDTAIIQTPNPAAQAWACTAGFPGVLRFLWKIFISTALWLCQQATTCHETAFHVSFPFSPRGKKKNKSISQQTYLLCGTKEGFQNGGQSGSSLIHKGLKGYTGDALCKFFLKEMVCFYINCLSSYHILFTVRI